MLTTDDESLPFIPGRSRCSSPFRANTAEMPLCGVGTTLERLPPIPPTASPNLYPWPATEQRLGSSNNHQLHLLRLFFRRRS